MSKILIMIKEDEVKRYALDEEDPVGWAEHWVRRRMEKENWECEEAYIVNEADALPVTKWINNYYDDKFKSEQENLAYQEKAELERLKKKYES